MESNNFQPGDVLSADRGFYKHYGIYVGNGDVVHFSAGNEGEISAKNAMIRKDSLDYFANGSSVCVDNKEQANFDRREIVNRANKMVGTMKGAYNLVSNNCEHFANWCKSGEKTSNQVIDVASVLPDGSYEKVKSFMDSTKEIVDQAGLMFKTKEEKDEILSKRTYEAYGKFSNKTKKLLDEYAEAKDSTTPENWIAGELGKVSQSFAEENYLNGYFQRLDAELDINDGYRKNINGFVKHGGSVETWVREHLFGTLKDDNGEKLQDKKNLIEVNANLFAADFHSDMSQSLEVLSKPQNIPTLLKSIFRNESEDEKRVAKRILATSMKIAGSPIFHIELPESVTVPVASASVEIGSAISDCVTKKIGVPKCIFRIGKEIAIGVVHVTKKAPEALVQLGKNIIKKVVPSISARIAEPVIRKTKSAVEVVKQIAHGCSVKGKEFVQKAVSVAKSVGGKIANAVKSKIGSAVKSVFSGRSKSSAKGKK